MEKSFTYQSKVHIRQKPLIMRKKLCILSFILIVCLGVVAYLRFVLTTRIAWVNFQDEQMAEIDAADSYWMIRSGWFSLKESDLAEVVDYDVIYLFHVKYLRETQLLHIKEAMNKGAQVHALLSTSDEYELSTLSTEDSTYVTSCFEHKSIANLQRWLNYSRKVLDKQRWFVDEVTPAEIFPKDVVYRIGTDLYFTDASSYWKYYKSEGLYKHNRPVVAVVNALVGPQDLFRSYQDQLIVTLEERGFNVAAVAGWKNRLQLLKDLGPNMLICFPHGRLYLAAPQQTQQWLEEENVLLLTPQLVHQSEEEWAEDQQGLSGSIFGQNIVVPELDGATYPYAIAARSRNEQGFLLYEPIPGRVEAFVEAATRWLALREQPVAERRLSIYYYKGAGKNAMVAGGLEVGASMHQLLLRLQAEGYNLGDLPEELSEFLARVQRDGPVLGSYAEGSLEAYLKKGRPAFVSAEEYEDWCRQALDAKRYAEVVASYGEAPGRYMTTRREDSSYIVIPRVAFGNVALLPVLPAALEGNEFRLVHGIKKAPPHAYIASYLWSRMRFKADVVMHFGAHGSVEFTPWRQVLLSNKDWPESLIAPLPHLYLYSVDNIGEAMMAKRRTYATMISHLTPPFAESELYGPLKTLSRLLHNYSSSGAATQLTYKPRILELVDSLALHQDLELAPEVIDSLSIETVDLLYDYVHHLEREQITTGLHVLGTSFTEEEINETAHMMSRSALASTLKELDQLSARVKPQSHRLQANRLHRHIHRTHTSSENYEERASRIIHSILKGSDPSTYISPAHLDFLEKHRGQGRARSAAQETHRLVPESSKSASSGKQKMVYDPKTHRLVPESSKSASSEEQNMVYDPKTHRLVPESSKSASSGKQKMVYDPKTHRLVPESSKSASSEEQKMVYDPKTHRLVPESSKSTTSELSIEELRLLDCLDRMRDQLYAVLEYKAHLLHSPEQELSSVVKGMKGGFISPSSGGDMISNPLALPTGRNLYSINAEATPSFEVFELGAKMARDVLKKHLEQHGNYPKKIAYTLWGGEFVRGQGLTIAQILYMLGVRPKRNQAGRVHDVELIPTEELQRPRVDVVVQTSGQFRDLAASRVYLINKAITLAAEADETTTHPNYVKEGTHAAEHELKARGFAPLEALRLSTVRVFGGLNGHYGTGIMEQVEHNDTWATEEEIAAQYLQNMGAIYAEGTWSDYHEGLFEEMLQGTEAVIHPRSSNVTGPIALDHVYEFMGGIMASIRVSTGRNPDGYFSDYRDRYQPQVQSLKEAIWVETRTHLFNPKYIRAQMNEGASAAEDFAENFRNTYGWNVMNPEAIDPEIWEGYYNIYVRDELQIGIHEFFKRVNPYALQEMTSVMLETIRRGYWKASTETKQAIIQLHAQLVQDHGAGCSRFVCDQRGTREIIEEEISGSLKSNYTKAINETRSISISKSEEEGLHLEKETQPKDQKETTWMRNPRTKIGLIAIIILTVATIVWGIVSIRRQNRSARY